MFINMFYLLKCFSKSPEEKDENQMPSSAPEIRDVFGDSDEEEEEGYVVQNDDVERDLSVSSFTFLLISDHSFQLLPNLLTIRLLFWLFDFDV